MPKIGKISLSILFYALPSLCDILQNLANCCGLHYSITKNHTIDMKMIIFFVLLLNFFTLPLPIAYANTVPLEVTHFFTHSLVAYPSIAFAKNNGMRSSYDKDCLTVTEFKRFLQALYEKNFMLIDISKIYQVDGDQPAIKRNFAFPSGKKPLVLSFDDTNYYSKKMHLGMNDKLILDKDNNLATFSEYATEKINYDNENVTILENFIAKHPDFSYQGAKGLICLTGFDGILGYRTQSDSPIRSTEIEKVKPLVKKLKDLNWKFACHSYGHYHMSKIGNNKSIYDSAKWLTEVQPLIGKTDIYCYPYGDWEITKNDVCSPKHQFLIDSGFKLFLGVGNKPFFNYLPYSKSIHPYSALFMDRKPIDGLSLRMFKESYSPYFDTYDIYDKETRYVKFA